ncbi:MAG TPA: hypothetical protein VFP72_12280 [Kineosporiaceae bacterium]|nr:hypothetical protein [Kineosporiaceae bacterium]
MKRRLLRTAMALALVAVALAEVRTVVTPELATAATSQATHGAGSSGSHSGMKMGSSPVMDPREMIKHRVTPAMRKAAADEAKTKGLHVASENILKNGGTKLDKVPVRKRQNATVPSTPSTPGGSGKATTGSGTTTTGGTAKGSNASFNGTADITTTGLATGAVATVADLLTSTVQATQAILPSSINGPITTQAAADAVLNSGNPPDYNGPVPNYANSPLPQLDAAGKVVPGTGIRKFVDSLPGLGAANKNDLGQYIPIAQPNTTAFPGSDYYVIAVRQYTEQLHADLPPTTLRGYVQEATDAAGKVQRDAAGKPIDVAPIHYLGPFISAQKGRAVRIKFVNELPTGTGGDLFLPVDTTAMGAGKGPDGTTSYAQNRATLHLHGGNTPWISDGTPHQWTTPAGENTTYPKGVSVSYVPDMWYDKNGDPVPAGTAGATNDPGAGAMTFYYTNQQSARLMFYHDHSYGITRLNVYAGEAAGYMINDPTEQQLITDGTLPADQIPMIIQDKTFVPGDIQLANEDPTWDRAKWGARGNLWFPHVYMPNQNPASTTGANAMGRWDYGPWFWPPYTGLTNGAKANPYYDPANPALAYEPATVPGTPTPSLVPEGFMDTPLVNGTAYPYVDVQRKAYRLRILNASNDRMLNLQLYYAKSNAPMWNADGTLNDANAGEVPMVPAAKTAGFPATWPTDGRDGGVPDPASRGPKLVEIGTDGGMLPAPVVLDSQPVDYNYNRRDITFGNVTSKTIMLGPAERADVIVDFSAVPAGAKLVLYNDAPAPNPALDPRNDYYTGDPDQTSTGGAPTTQPGYGPNTRTIMQFRVDSSTPAATYDLAKLQTALPNAFKASQHEPIVPQKVYNPATTNQTSTDNYVRIQDTSISFTPYGGNAAASLALQPKTIQELFETAYGRMNATLGVELPNTNANVQTTIPMGYAEPVTEVFSPSDIGTPVGSLNDGTQLWKITHNGVDTHAIHFHLMDVQLVNRVGWDGAIKPPDPNELGWKDTLRMNPLEDVVIAIRPATPSLPFKLGDSWRPIDPTMPVGAKIATFDPKTGNAITVPNAVTNFGWEYVWHCHLLGHEENDMMRAIRYEVTPAAPSGLSVAQDPAPAAGVTLKWTNNATTTPFATNFFVQRATDAAFTTDVQNFDLTAAAQGQNPIPTTWTDGTTAPSTTYYYRVRAENTVAYSQWTAGSSVTTRAPALLAPTQLTATDTSTPASTPPVPQVTLGWIAAGGADSYTIVRATDAAFTQNVTTVQVPGGASNSYVDNGVTWAGTYYYQIQTVNSTNNPGTSPWSSPAVSVTVQNTVPDVPANLTATASPAAPTVSVALSWGASARATGYTIQRSTDPAFASPVSFTTTGTTFTDNAVLSGVTYYYQVQATNAVGASAWSSPAAKVTVSTVAIPVPANLTATADPAKVTITLGWAPSLGANAYDVQRATDATFTQNVSDTIVTTGAAWTDTAVTPGTTYYYRVNASTVQGGPSAWSNTASATVLLAPTGVAVTASASWPLTTTVTWTAASAATGYVVQRATDAGFTTGVTSFTPTGNVTSYTDTTVLPTTQYWYRVQSTGPGGPSPWSAAATVATPTVSLVTPAGLAAATTPAAPAGVKLTWTGQPWAASYTVIRATNSTFTTGWTTFTTNTASYTDTTIVVGTRYYYRVQATYPSINGLPAAASNLSASVNLTVRAPSTPGNLTLTATAVAGPPASANVNLTWTAGTGAGSYVIQRSTSSTFATVQATLTVSGTTLNYTDTGLARNTRYYYRIQAVNGAGASGWRTGSVRTPL